MIPNHISYNLPVRIYSRTTRENSLTWCLLDISIPGIDINYTQHSVLHISWIGTRFDLKYLSRIHPYLFATFPVLALFSVNAGEFEEELILRALLLTILAAGVFHLTARLFLGEWILASILTTSLLLFFFSYGHIYEFMKNWHLGDWVIGRHRFLLPTLSVLLVLFLLRLFRRRRDTAVFLPAFLGLMGVSLIAVPIFSLVGYMFSKNLAPKFSSDPSLVHESLASDSIAETRPDIFYIILDGYARGDTLEAIYNVDNDPFLDSLRNKGFYIADQSLSNYMTTLKSLTASLNMSYLDVLADDYDLNLKSNDPFVQLFRHSQVRSFLEERGYQMVAFDSGWPRTRIKDAAIYLQTDDQAQAPAFMSWYVNEFELLLLRTTILRPYIDLKTREIGETSRLDSYLYQNHRQRIHSTFQLLEEIPTWDGDYFVFAHIISPHPPFIFGPDGQVLTPPWEFTIHDGSDFPGTREDYITGYSAQIRYINKLVLILITQLISDSENPPIIIIQGDHGPRAFMDWESVDQTDVQESMSILNAYFVPDQIGIDFYESISPVNSFRVLFNQYFDADYTLLEDHSYYTTDSNPYNFIIVDDQVR